MALQPRTLSLQVRRSWAQTQPPQFETINSDIEDWKRDLKRKVILKNPKRVKWHKDRIREFRKDLKLAAAYQTECATIRNECGYREANDAYYAATKALHSHVDTIMGEPEKTITGVVIKAEALSGWGKVQRVNRSLNIEAPEWSDAMAAAVMRRVVVSGAV